MTSISLTIEQGKCVLILMCFNKHYILSTSLSSVGKKTQRNHSGWILTFILFKKSTHLFFRARQSPRRKRIHIECVHMHDIVVTVLPRRSCSLVGCIQVDWCDKYLINKFCSLIYFLKAVDTIGNYSK